MVNGNDRQKAETNERKLRLHLLTQASKLVAKAKRVLQTPEAPITIPHILQRMKLPTKQISLLNLRSKQNRESHSWTLKPDAIANKDFQI